jgi:hypothetical protein
MYESLCAWLTDNRARMSSYPGFYYVRVGSCSIQVTRKILQLVLWRLRTWIFEPSLILSGDKIRWQQTVVAHSSDWLSASCAILAGICFLPIPWPMTDVAQSCLHYDTSYLANLKTWHASWNYLQANNMYVTKVGCISTRKSILERWTKKSISPNGPPLWRNPWKSYWPNQDGQKSPSRRVRLFCPFLKSRTFRTSISYWDCKIVIFFKTHLVWPHRKTHHTSDT